MIEITPVHDQFVAKVRGADLTRKLAPEVRHELEQALGRYAVLIFPETPLTDEQQVAFTSEFGPLELPPNYARDAPIGGKAEINQISNVDKDGRILSEHDRQRLFALANRLWHTDGTFKRVPSLCSLLQARAVPPEGGNTEFADMRAAFDALPEARQRELEGLTVEHSIYRSRKQIGFESFNPEIYETLPPVQQVMVRVHPVTGRKSLYLASHASHVIGRPVEEGRKLIEELIAFSTQPRFVYSHHWQVGDLVMWDNRSVMHRATPYDDVKYRRVMHRTTARDVANSIEQAEMFGWFRPQRDRQAAGA
jgi:alpha-ketoglutarate-dependent 2,4-dichlorophenoxyacetate dioxygenase